MQLKFLEERKKAKALLEASSTAAKSASYFFAGSTKDINVLENRYLQPAVHIANDPTDVEHRLQALVVMKRVRIEEFFRDFSDITDSRIPSMDEIAGLGDRYGLPFAQPEWLAEVIARYGLTPPPG